MEWINSQLSSLTFAEGYRSVALGGLFGLISGFTIAFSQGLPLEISFLVAFLSVYPGSIFMTVMFVLLAKIRTKIQ